MWRYTIGQRREVLARWIAWHLPRTVVTWCVMRVFTHATTGRWSQTHPDSLGYGELMRRWEIPDNRRVMQARYPDPAGSPPNA